MYLEYSEKGYFLDIKKESNYKNKIEITKEQETEVYKALSDKKIVKVVDGEIVFLVNEALKRIDIVEKRNELLEVAGRFVDRPTYFEELGLTTEEVADAKEYYLRLLRMPEAYDNSDNKQEWYFRFVDVYTSAKNSNNYQLYKPEFVK